jgi:hypothetical protein
MTVLEDTELNVVDDRMALMAIQVSSLDEASREEKRRAMEFAEATSVSFSYKRLSRVDYLAPFRDLTKLQLDNNALTKIEGLDHLVHLKWLDLSFNFITKMENLTRLTKLEDLSLYRNEIDAIEGLEACQDTLVSLSLGENQIKYLETFEPLRALRNLRLVNFAGNPVCEEEDYAPFLLSRIRDLKYLDHRLVRSDAVERARDQYADELAEIEAEEEEHRASKRKSREKEARDRSARERNVAGVAELFDDMLRDDPEFEKLRKLPSEKESGVLMKGLPAFREAFERVVEEFQKSMEIQFLAKREETAEWRSALDGALAAKQKEARALVRELDTERKHAFRGLKNLDGSRENAGDFEESALERERAETERNDQVSRAENKANLRRVRALIRDSKAAARSERRRSLRAEKISDATGAFDAAADTESESSDFESETSDSDSETSQESGLDVTSDPNESDDESEAEVDVYERTGRWLRKRGEETKQKLFAVESHCADFVARLIFEYDRNYSAIVDRSEQVITGLFTEMRRHEDAYFAEMSEASTAMLEQFSTGVLDDARDEDAAVILGDKDTFLNAVRAHHDFRVNAVDQKEDALRTEERKRLDAVLAELRVWERERNRCRVEEILGHWERHRELVNAFCGEEDADEAPEKDG